MEDKELDDFRLSLQELQAMADPENYVPAISGPALMEMEFPPREHVVRGLITKGLSILAGKAKIGKSWLVLDLCLHVAKGEPFWGMEVEQGTAWYLSLEDTNDRMQWRLSCITADVPDNIQITTKDHKPGTMADSLPGVIDKFMRKYPDTKLIVIDTMQVAKGTSKDPQYGRDYMDTNAFKDIADKYKVAVVLTHHLRKMGDKDPLNKISGSTGISGAADSLLVLDRPKRMKSNAKLICTGRDIVEREMELQFDKTDCLWKKITDSAGEDAPQLPPEMLMLVDFVKSIGSYEGGNTALAEQFAQYTGINWSAKVLKQKMNRWRYELEEAGVRFRSYETSHGKMVAVSYTPPTSHISQNSQKVPA